MRSRAPRASCSSRPPDERARSPPEGSRLDDLPDRYHGRSFDESLRATIDRLKRAGAASAQNSRSERSASIDPSQLPELAVMSSTRAGHARRSNGYALRTFAVAARAAHPRVRLGLDVIPDQLADPSARLAHCLLRRHRLAPPSRRGRVVATCQVSS